MLTAREVVSGKEVKAARAGRTRRGAGRSTLSRVSPRPLGLAPCPTSPRCCNRTSHTATRPRHTAACAPPARKTSQTCDCTARKGTSRPPSWAAARCDQTGDAPSTRRRGSSHHRDQALSRDYSTHDASAHSARGAGRNDVSEHAHLCPSSPRSCTGTSHTATRPRRNAPCVTRTQRWSQTCGCTNRRCTCHPRLSAAGRSLRRGTGRSTPSRASLLPLGLAPCPASPQCCTCTSRTATRPRRRSGGDRRARATRGTLEGSVRIPTHLAHSVPASNCARRDSDQSMRNRVSLHHSGRCPCGAYQRQCTCTTHTATRSAPHRNGRAQRVQCACRTRHRNRHNASGHPQLAAPTYQTAQVAAAYSSDVCA